MINEGRLMGLNFQHISLKSKYLIKLIIPCLLEVEYFEAWREIKSIYGKTCLLQQLGEVGYCVWVVESGH